MKNIPVQLRMIRKYFIVFPMEKETIIAVQDLSYNYGDGAVLSAVNFSIQSGDFVGLIGGNGSGKSTLLKLILGRLSALDGRIELFGSPIKDFKDWSKLAYIPQKAGNFNSDFPIYVEELVSLPLQSLQGKNSLTRKEKDARVTEALQTVGMYPYRKRRIGALSGGQQQRVFIAKALVTRPKLLILDEPTVGIDHEAESDIYKLLGRLNHEHHLSILWVSHDIAAVTSLTNRLLCIGPDGFFEHRYAEAGTEVDLQKLYGFEIKAHTHNH